MLGEGSPHNLSVIRHENEDIVSADYAEATSDPIFILLIPCLASPRKRPPERGGRPLLPCLQSGTLPAAGGTWWKTQGVCHQRSDASETGLLSKQLASEPALRTVPRQDVVPTTACRSPPRRGARDLGPRRSAGFRLPARAWSPPRGGSRLPHARRPRVFSSPAAAEPGSPADLSPTESVRGT
jgi:hypothetical protein